jgi:hypothetical protein
MGAYDFDLEILGGRGVVLLPPIGRESEMIRRFGNGTGRNLWARIEWVFFLFVLLFGLGVTSATAAPKAEAWTFWAANDPAGQVRVDHDPWDQFLKKYVVANHPSGVNRVRYASVTPEDRKELEDYLQRLQGVDVTRLKRSEQKSYWIDLYNALTVKVVLDHYPVKSIRDIKISPGLFSSGPWGAKLLTIQGQKVSLDDIEHRILRPLWKDNRVHYAVNCASLGCPNLQPEAYKPENTESLLEKGAREYVNHSRGVRLSGDRLLLSSIYDWFQEDFGGSEESVSRNLQMYANPELAMRLKEFGGKFSYDYDWRINENIEHR